MPFFFNMLMGRPTLGLFVSDFLGPKGGDLCRGGPTPVVEKPTLPPSINVKRKRGIIKMPQKLF